MTQTTPPPNDSANRPYFHPQFNRSHSTSHEDVDSSENPQEKALPSEAPEGEALPGQRAHAERSHVGRQSHNQRVVQFSRSGPASARSFPCEFQVSRKHIA